jgi:hypothetical protein
VTPSNWLAATVTFRVLPYLLKGESYLNNEPTSNQLAWVYAEAGEGVLYSIITQAGLGFYAVPPTLFNGVRYINMVSSAAQTNAPQVSLVLTPLWQGVHA